MNMDMDDLNTIINGMDEDIAKLLKKLIITLLNMTEQNKKGGLYE